MEGEYLNDVSFLAGERSYYVAAVCTKTVQVRSKLLILGHKCYMIDDIGVYSGVDPSSAPDMHKREGRNTPSVDISRLNSPYRNSGHQSTLASVASCPGSQSRRRSRWSPPTVKPGRGVLGAVDRKSLHVRAEAIHLGTGRVVGEGLLFCCC